MKKITTTLLVIIACTASSCGPKRHGCGPGRCEIQQPQKQIDFLETNKYIC
jgi:hypothetical protein